MLQTVKGYYDHGKIILEEKAPVEEKTEVMVTFLLEDKKEMKGKSKRILGIREGKIRMSEDFNEGFICL